MRTTFIILPKPKHARAMDVNISCEKLISLIKLGSEEERSLKKVIIQDVTRNIVDRLYQSSDFKSTVLNTVCYYLKISEEQLFQHLKETFNGTVGQGTSAKVASQFGLYVAIKNRKLCEIWSKDTDILTKAAWHTIKIFFLEKDGKFYNDWINDWKAGNEKDRELFLRYREAIWPRFENPDEYMTPADKRRLREMNVAGNVEQGELELMDLCSQFGRMRTSDLVNSIVLRDN